MAPARRVLKVGIYICKMDWTSEPALLREMLAGVLSVVTITYTANRKC